MITIKSSSSVLCGQLSAFHCAKSLSLLKIVCFSDKHSSSSMWGKMHSRLQFTSLSSTVLCGFFWVFSMQIQTCTHAHAFTGFVYNLAFVLGSLAQLCLTLSNPMDHSLPGSSVHQILQARTPEWVAIFFSRRSSRPRD